jgi:hypothetical protein
MSEKSESRKPQRVSRECSEGSHADCKETLDTCSCTCQVGHRTMHRYMNLPAMTESTTKPAGARELADDLKRDIEYESWRSGYGEPSVRPKDAWDAGWRYSKYQAGQITAENERLKAALGEVVVLHDKKYGDWKDDILVKPCACDECKPLREEVLPGEY